MRRIRRFTRRFTDAAEERMQLAEDGEADSVVRAEKQRTAREAASADGVVSDSTNVSILIERLMRGYDKRLRPNYKGRLMRSYSITCFVGADF